VLSLIHTCLSQLPKTYPVIVLTVNMRHAEPRRITTCNTCTSLLLVLSLKSLPEALAQDIPSVSSTLTTRTSVTMPPAASFESTSTSISSPSTPITPNQPPLQTYPELFAAAEQTPQGSEVKNRVFNYYFLFLALLAVMLAALFWWMHRERRRQQEQIRLRGQRALLRDVERWAMYRRHEEPVVEGLDQHGEAPPPYKPKGETVTTLEDVNDTMDGAVNVAIPPRALSRDDTEHIRLPDYSETIFIDGGRTDVQQARSLDETSTARVRST
jgi:hypothetical protein